MLPMDEEPPELALAPDADDADDADEDDSEAVLLDVEVFEEADAAASDPDEEPLEEPTTSLESVDAVSQAANKKVAAQIVKRRFIMEFPIQIR